MNRMWLKTEWKRAAGMLPVILKRAVLLLLAFCAAAGAAAFGIIAVNRQSDDSRMRIGYAAADSALTDMVVAYIEEIESVKALCSIEQVPQADGLRLLQEGELDAFVMLPGNIVEEIISGQNTPITVYLSFEKRSDDGTYRTLKTMLFRELADAAVGLLETAQAEIYAVQYVLGDALYAEDLDIQSLYGDINHFNLSVAAGREKLFKTRTVSVTGNDTYVIYYGSAILTIYMLFAGIFFSGFFYRSAMWQNMLEKRLHVSRLWQIICGFLAGLLPMAATGLLPFAVFLLPFAREMVSLHFSWNMIWLLFLVMACCELYVMLLYRIFKEKRAAFFAIGILALIQGYLSGCIVPSVLLPDLAYGIGKCLPAAFVKQAFTVIFSDSTSKLSLAAGGLAAWSAVFLAANCLWAYLGVMQTDRGLEISVKNKTKSVSVPPVAWVIFKRMILKKSVLASLALMILVSVLIMRLEKQSDTTFLVAVFDESGEYEEQLLAHDTLVRFRICKSADEVEDLVLRDEAECGYLLPKTLTADVVSGRANRVITVYEDADSVCVPLVNEVIFQSVFRRASLEWYKDYMSAFRTKTMLIEEAFWDQIALGKTFGIEFATVERNGAVDVDRERNQTYPVFAVVVTSLILCGAGGVLAVMEDYKKGRFYRRSRRKIAILTIALPILIAVVIGGGLVILSKLL